MDTEKRTAPTSGVEDAPTHVSRLLENPNIEKLRRFMEEDEEDPDEEFIAFLREDI